MSGALNAAIDRAVASGRRLGLVGDDLVAHSMETARATEQLVRQFLADQERSQWDLTVLPGGTIELPDQLLRRAGVHRLPARVRAEALGPGVIHLAVLP